MRDCADPALRPNSRQDHSKAVNTGDRGWNFCWTGCAAPVVGVVPASVARSASGPLTCCWVSFVIEISNALRGTTEFVPLLRNDLTLCALRIRGCSAEEVGPFYRIKFDLISFLLNSGRLIWNNRTSDLL